MADDRKIVSVKMVKGVSREDNVSATQYYMDIKSGKRELAYVHPDLKKYTTSSIFVFQEQVMFFLVEFAGYTLEESDRIRGAIAKKNPAVMHEAFGRIREKCEQRGWTEEQTQTVCDQVMAFSKYSFNRAHSRCYSELGYITMYLKHYYPLEWWTSVLNTSKEQKTRFFMTLLGGMIKSPSLLNPSNKFSIQDESIIAPISALKRVGPAAVAELIDKGPFTSIEDYIKRVRHNKVNAGHFGAMIRGRAVDCFMDPLVEDYATARADMLDFYKKRRKCKDFAPEMYQLDPMSVFLMERDTNKCFNKTLLSEPEISNKILIEYPHLLETDRKDIPFLRSSDATGIKTISTVEIPILSGLKVAKGLVDRKWKEPVGMILLYNGSNHKVIFSKKTGKKYDLLEIALSDGFNDITCSLWGVSKPLRWDKNSIVYVRGKLSEGFRTPVSMTVEDIEQIKEK